MKSMASELCWDIVFFCFLGDFFLGTPWTILWPIPTHYQPWRQNQLRWILPSTKPHGLRLEWRHLVKTGDFHSHWDTHKLDGLGWEKTVQMVFFGGTLYNPHFTLHTLHSTLHTLHSLHSTLYTPYFTHYTPHFTLHTLHSTSRIDYVSLCMRFPFVIFIRVLWFLLFIEYYSDTRQTMIQLDLQTRFKIYGEVKGAVLDSWL